MIQFEQEEAGRLEKRSRLLPCHGSAMMSSTQSPEKERPSYAAVEIETFSTTAGSFLDKSGTGLARDWCRR